MERFNTSASIRIGILLALLGVATADSNISLSNLGLSNQTEEIWKYFVTKYSASTNFSLTPTEIASIVYINQNSTRPGGILNSEGRCECPIASATSTSTSSPSLAISRSRGIGVISTPDCALSIPPQIFNFTDICPHILYLIDNPTCWSSFAVSDKSQNVEQSGDGSEISKPSSTEVWGYGVLFVTIISCCSVAGVSVMPFIGKTAYKNILTVLIGLAVGSLTGSSVFHLIPQAYGLVTNNTNHSYLYTSFVICGGVWMFFMVERLLRIVMEHKERKDSKRRRAMKSSIYSSTPENSTNPILMENGLDKEVPNTEGSLTPVFCPMRNSDTSYEIQEQAIIVSFPHQEKPKCGHDKLVKFEQGKDSVIATVAWMIIFGDGLHNFIDGLSIGAAFNESILTGVSISVAVFCEELPHELGDFAVLLNAGMSVRQALMYNFLSACTCYLGLGVGILLGEIEASIYIFGLAGGMFLYISLVDMVPEMNEVAEESSKVSVLEGLKILALQNIGIFLGITILFTLAKYQENIHF